MDNQSLLNNQWFYLYPEVYVSLEKQGYVLLYHTKTGKKLISNNPVCIQLIRDVYMPKNLGVIELTERFAANEICRDFIQDIIDKNLGSTVDKAEFKSKPINLLPILNLQNDIDKMVIDNEQTLIGMNILSYLSELTIYINADCNRDCVGCGELCKQSKACFVRDDMQELPVYAIEQILSQCKVSSLNRVNIIGGDILRYSSYDELRSMLSHYAYDYYLYCHYLNYDEKLQRNSFIKELCIIVPFPIDKLALKKVLLASHKESETPFHFIFYIENEEQIVEIEQLLPDSYSVVPFYNGSNKDFFRRNVFITEEDFSNSPISMRQIFSNQKVNANFFGSLTIYQDGCVKAMATSSELGNIYTHRIADIVYKELCENSAWRKIRNNQPCAACYYRYLCPSPSIYESCLKQSNLCTMIKE
jgi:pseudo-rSAM protein